MSSDGVVEAGRVPPTRPAHFGPPDSLRTIVTRPRATVRWILDHGDGGLWAFLALGALAALSIPGYPTPSPNDLLLPPPTWLERLFIPAATLGIGIVVLTCFWLLATVAGRVLGGVGRWSETRLALSWALVPLVASIPAAVTSLFVDPARNPFFAASLRGFEYVAFAGTCVLAVFALAEAHRFSWQRSAAALLAAAAILGFAAMIAFGVFYGMAMDD